MISPSAKLGLEKHETKIKPERSPCYSYPPPPYAAKHPIPTSLVISLGIAGAALLLLSYFAMRRYASRRRSSPPPPPPPSPFLSYNNREDFADGLRGPVVDHPVWYIRTVGLPQSAVDSIHRFIYKKGDGLIETSGCSVCLSDFDDGDSLRLLPKCSHAFHVACIDTWLGSHTNCPLCRAPVLAAGGGQSGAVESSSSLSFISGEIEMRGEESGEMSNAVEINNRAMIGQEMEPMRRSISLDFSSALSNADVEKPYWIMRSMSISGPSILV